MLHVFCVCVCVYVCVVELKSKTIAGKMLEGIVRVCDQELCSKTGQPQVHVSYT